MDGSGPTSIFCVLHNALQQLTKINGEVDILTTVRLIQTRRPEVITKMVINGIGLNVKKNADLLYTV